MEAYPRPGLPAPQKNKTPVILSVVTLALFLLFALASLVAIVILFINGSAGKSDLAALTKQVESQGSGLSALKNDLVLLKEKARAPGPNFTVSGLKLTFSSYYSDVDYYYGEATVNCSDVSGSYVLVMKQTVNSGGSPNRNKVEYFLIPISNGSGNFYTTDSALKGTLAKPDYTFEVVGYLKTNNVKE